VLEIVLLVRPAKGAGGDGIATPLVQIRGDLVDYGLELPIRKQSFDNYT
jgi:hypothetical protein